MAQITHKDTEKNQKFNVVWFEQKHSNFLFNM